MDIFLIKVITQLIMPPNPMLLLILAGAIIYSRSQRIGKLLFFSGFGLLVIFSLPIVSAPVIVMMENVPVLQQEKIKNTGAQAIIILGGGSYVDAPEYGEDTVSLLTLERITFGSFVQKNTQLPILVTGGRVFPHKKNSEATLMQKVLQSQLHTPVTWLEEQSRNTWENATYSYEILNTHGIKKIILVTHAIHMRRSIMYFEAAGFEVIPAPLGFNSQSNFLSSLKIFPSIGAMSNLQQALHEIMGMIWYKLRYM